MEGEFTSLLIEWRQGNQAALDALLPLVYDELRRIAARQMARERPDHTLQATALVHEAWMHSPELRKGFVAKFDLGVNAFVPCSSQSAVKRNVLLCPYRNFSLCRDMSHPRGSSVRT